MSADQKTKKETVRVGLEAPCVVRERQEALAALYAAQPPPVGLLKKETVRISIPRKSATSEHPYAVSGTFSSGVHGPASADSLMQQKGLFEYLRWKTGNFLKRWRRKN